MIPKMKRIAAKYFRTLLLNGVHKKQAIANTCKAYNICRATLYVYCKKYKVPTS